jgi:DNA-binding transcriptional LysR family regulator
MTQSAVSDHIRRLEEFLDTQLFYRTGRSAKLNSAGQDLLPLAEQMLELLEKMRKPSADKPLRGTIRIGSIASMHSTLVARAMVLFRRSRPDVTIRAVRIETGAAGHVERGELDLAVTIRPVNLPPNRSAGFRCFGSPTS